jgi:hypothetical protein
MEYTAKIREPKLVRFQERLLSGIRVGSVKCSSARHTPHGEELQRSLLSVEPSDGFKPIDLPFLPEFIGLRHEYLAPADPHLPLTFPDILPDCGLSDGIICILLTQPHPDAMRRVPLLARCPLIVFENAIDEVFDRP